MATVHIASMMAIDKLTNMAYNCSVLGEVKLPHSKHTTRNQHRWSWKEYLNYAIMVRFLDTSLNPWYDYLAVGANEPRPPQFYCL